MSLYDSDQFHFSENEVSNEDYRMIEEFGDFYSSCGFNKPFCWAVKLNRRYCVMPACWSRLDQGWGNGLSRSGHLEEENGNLKKTDCKQSRLIVFNSGLDVRGVKTSDSVNKMLVSKLFV